jgi:secretion/DNA translocation related TadE-like protein
MMAARRPMSRERGSVTPLFLAAIAMAMVLAMGAARLGAAAVGKARAETAADAAALAAADSLALGGGSDTATAAARATADANGARLLSCRCVDHDAWVEVELPVRALGERRVRALGHAVVDSAGFSDSVP